MSRKAVPTFRPDLKHTDIKHHCVRETTWQQRFTSLDCATEGMNAETHPTNIGCGGTEQFRILNDMLELSSMNQINRQQPSNW
ncbi:hypothetical protein K493DRAFT_315816 [Basidiobolus meristosporus CBS 931.73]|uniref:Uncharacterized protein n=1 Tax=Basidiobolus meristosporus CBS 931.73 TaxID=1314790 RepID=A0A1Y1Y707_9FUNG|nr:hypothetical protein K493DRAFT_315816 [Basidiobolus meristosporus CBS 931.73]|eukprot:ORX93768.1 hypothetical protein K493DRAFT_315816 [Basidiobolus meristosporus CBS 931.73]